MSRVINPDSLAPPRGYSNGLMFEPGHTLFVAGQIGWDKDCRFVSDDLVEQFAQAMDNILDVVRAAGGGPEHIGRLTIYVTDRDAYAAGAKAIGKAYRERMGKNYPAMALLQVAALLEPRAQIEIEATAILPATEGAAS